MIFKLHDAYVRVYVATPAPPPLARGRAAGAARGQKFQRDFRLLASGGAVRIGRQPTSEVAALITSESIGKETERRKALFILHTMGSGQGDIL